MSKENHRAVRTYAKKFRDNLYFTSENLGAAQNVYVAWLDLMGAGHIMSTSVQKSANFLVRLHMAVEIARRENSFAGRLLPINDGIYILSGSKQEIINMVRHIMVILATNFISIPRPHDRFLMRGAVAFGPVYFGEQLSSGVRNKRMREDKSFLHRILFGPPIIQAYHSERASPPYGITLHESARAFSPDGDDPFRTTHWLWWQPMDEAKPVANFPPLTDLKDCLLEDLLAHLEWMKDSLLFHGLDAGKIESWKQTTSQYFKWA